MVFLPSASLSAESVSLCPSLNLVFLCITLHLSFFPSFHFLFSIFQTPVSASPSLHLLVGWKPRRTQGRAVPKSIPHSLPLSFLPLPPSLSHRSTVLPSSSLLRGLAAARITVLLFVTVFLFQRN